MPLVTAIARLKIHDGKLEEFKRLAALCVNSPIAIVESPLRCGNCATSTAARRDSQRC